MVALWTEYLKANSRRKSLNSANPKVKEQSHTAVRAKTQKAPSVINALANVKLITSTLPMMPSPIHAEKRATTSVCVCAGKTVHGIEEEEESFFLGSVTSDVNAWTADIGIMDKNITFKLDTGADVTAVSQRE